MGPIEAALTAHLLRWEGKPFAFGTADCVNFTVDWIDAQRGTSFGTQTALQYRALPFRELRMLGEPGRLRAAVIDALGAPSDTLTPKAGDVVLFLTGEGKEALGVAGEALLYGPDRNGLSGIAQAQRVTAVWPLERIVPCRP